MVLLPMFFYCLLVRRDKKWYRYLTVIAVFLLMQGIHLLMMGTVSPEGTGGTSLKDTSTVQGAITNFVLEALCSIGVNARPKHLCGRPWRDTSFRVRVLVLFWNLTVLFYLLISSYQPFLSKRYRRRGAEGMKFLRGLIFFLDFWIGSAAASAVTIRVELHWIYVLYAFQLLLLAYLYGIRRASCEAQNADPETKRRYQFDNAVPSALLSVVVLLSLVIQQYCRRFTPKIYLFPDQTRYNSLADVAYGRYGREMLDKDIVIVGNNYEMSDLTERIFFKAFDPAHAGRGTVVRHMASVYDIGLIYPDMLVLFEGSVHNTFLDETKTMRELQYTVNHGYYEDEWTNQRASLRILLQESGELHFRMTCPGTLRDGKGVTVENGNSVRHFPLTKNRENFTIAGTPFAPNNFRFSTSFQAENVAEQRGDTPLALLARFDVDTGGGEKAWKGK